MLLRPLTAVLTLHLAVSSAVPSRAQDWDCSKADDLPQQGMNYCAAMDYDRADKALNVVWPRVREHMQSVDASLPADLRGAEDELMKAQRAWIDYRDGECAAEGFFARGGTLEPLLVATCKAKLTRDRTEELLLLMQDY